MVCAAYVLDARDQGSLNMDALLFSCAHLATYTHVIELVAESVSAPVPSQGWKQDWDDRPRRWCLVGRTHVQGSCVFDPGARMDRSPKGRTSFEGSCTAFRVTH